MPEERDISGKELLQDELTPNPEIIRGVIDEQEVIKDTIMPGAELFPTAPPPQPQQPAPENKDGGDKK